MYENTEPATAMLAKLNRFFFSDDDLDEEEEATTVEMEIYYQQLLVSSSSSLDAINVLIIKIWRK